MLTWRYVPKTIKSKLNGALTQLDGDLPYVEYKGEKYYMWKDAGKYHIGGFDNLFEGDLLLQHYVAKKQVHYWAPQWLQTLLQELWAHPVVHQPSFYEMLGFEGKKRFGREIAIKWLCKQLKDKDEEDRKKYMDMVILYRDLVMEKNQ